MPRSRQLFAIAVLAVALGGCETIQGWVGGTGASADKVMAVGCTAYASTLVILTPIKVQMTSNQVAIVDGVVATVGPACRSWAQSGAAATEGQADAAQAGAGRLLELKITMQGR